MNARIPQITATPMQTALAILLRSKKPFPVTVIAQTIAKMVMRVKTILITFRMAPFFIQSRSFIKFGFILFSKPKPFNPSRKLLMPDVAPEDFAVHQLCAFAARHKASNTFAGTARSCATSEFLNSGHSTPDTIVYINVRLTYSADCQESDSLCSDGSEDCCRLLLATLTL